MTKSSILKISIAVLVATLISSMSLAAVIGIVIKNSDGEPANGITAGEGISADGRFVVFCTTATNLLPDDTIENWEVFVHDRQTGENSRVSVSSEGQAANGDSCGRLAAISADGRFVVFGSDADNLVAGDTNAGTDYFVHDRQTKETTMVNVTPTGEQVDTSDWKVSGCDPSISAEGRFVVFCSGSDSLAAGDQNGERDVVVHDRTTGKTTLASGGFSSLINDCVNDYPDGDVGSPSISANGRFVAFSTTQQLTPEAYVGYGCPGVSQVFVRDLQTGTITHVSVNAEGEQADSCYGTSISADGRFVAFESEGKIFVKDLQKNILIPIPIDRGFADGPKISPDGRFVTFLLRDGIRDAHAVLYDIHTDKKTLISVNKYGELTGSESKSLNNAYVLFNSDPDFFFPGDKTPYSSMLLYEIFEGADGLFSADFDSGTQGFSYHDDVFRSTTRPAYAKGDHTPTGGYAGTGGLHVCVGNVDYKWVLNGMSGGWSKDFYLENESDLNFSLKYRLKTSNYDADECGEALVAIDGKIVMELAKRCGRGHDTGWQTETFNQILPKGNHTLTVGVYGNKKTGMLEKTDVYFDDISIKIEGESTSETNCKNGVDDDGDGLVDCDDSDCDEAAFCQV